MTGGMSGIEISSIVDLSYLQALHDVFSDDMKSRGIEVASAILDEKAVPLTFEFNHCSFCKEIRKTKAGLQVCRASDLYGICVAKEHLERTGQVRPVFYVCKQGLVDFCAPIVVRQDVEGRKREVPVAYFFGGQFRYTGERKDIVTPAEPSLGLLARTAQTLQERPPDSSDLCVRFHQTTYLDETQFHQLEAAATSFTDVLNGVVQKLYDWRRVKRLEDFMAGAATVRGVDELFELVIESVPEMIHARHCSIFTIQRDEPSGCEHLVLRKTSYEKLKAEENSAYYNKGEGLTGWVWEHAHSLRLENLQDPAERMAHGRLDWKHKYNDSDEHRGFLCVPIVGARRDVIGVIRVPHKEPGNFDKYDEIFLNFLAGHLSSVIQCQLAQERFDREGRVAGLVDIATRLGRARSYSRVLDATITGSLALFGGDGKKHFVNILTSDGNYWRVEREVG
ncbi:MAG: PocR ligand-binding domain-containing protein, partial [Deltaproteobacteria bacterium]|nr:PocR ligand-binding domain-containing protein [Deltaproteobacteria bacterium]